MGVTLYMDVHVPGPITRQLRRRGVDVVTAQEDGYDAAPDEQVLARATVLGRILFTQDVRFRARAEAWQRQGREFAGLDQYDLVGGCRPGFHIDQATGFDGGHLRRGGRGAQCQEANAEYRGSRLHVDLHCSLQSGVIKANPVLSR